MTTAALGFGLVSLAQERLLAAPDPVMAAAGRVRGFDPDLADQYERWSATLAGIRSVDAALRAGDTSPPQVPAVTFYLVSDDFNPEVAPTTGAAQRARAVLAVVHVVDAVNTRRTAGGAAVDPLEDLVGATQAVLHGWRPYETSRADALALQRGRLLGPPADGRAWWQDEYLFSWQAFVHHVIHTTFDEA